MIVINLYLRNSYWCLHLLLNSALLNEPILCKQYQDGWPAKYGILTGTNTYIEHKTYSVQSFQAVQCIPAKNQSFLYQACEEERLGMQAQVV